MTLWHQTLKLYRAQDRDMADLQLINLQRAHPDKPLYALYLARIVQVRRTAPGPDWDGAWSFESK